MNRTFTGFLAAAAVLALALPGLASPALADQGTSGDAVVEVRFSNYLADKLADIDRIERARERRFRKYRDVQRTTTRSLRQFTENRFPGVKWANENLVEDIDAYGVESLLGAMLRENLDRAVPGGVDGTIRVTLERLHVSNHSLATLSGATTYAQGTIERLDSSGTVIESHKVSASMSPHFTTDPGYDGPDFAFVDTDAANRMGPIMAEFAKASLGKLWPGSDFADPVLVLVDSNF